MKKKQTTERLGTNQKQPSKTIAKIQPEFQIEVIVLSTKKILDCSKDNINLNDLRSDLVMRKLVLGDMAATEQKVDEKFEVLKISKFDFDKSLELKIENKNLYIDFKNADKKNQLSLVEYPSLFLQFYRFRYNEQFYLVPKKNYFTNHKIHKMEENTVYSEKEILLIIKSLAHEFIKPKTIIDCKPL